MNSSLYEDMSIWLLKPGFISTTSFFAVLIDNPSEVYVDPWVSTSRTAFKPLSIGSYVSEVKLKIIGLPYVDLNKPPSSTEEMNCECPIKIAPL